MAADREFQWLRWEEPNEDELSTSEDFSDLHSIRERMLYVLLQ